MRVVLAAGGTGGHIYPAIAVAHEIMRRDANARVLFVGTARGLETRLVPNAGFELKTIESSGLKSVGVMNQVKGLSLIPRAMWQARKIIKDFNADAVVGAGGYVTGPVLLTAWMMNVPTLVMESNALPGFTNRVLGRVCTAAAVSFDEAVPYFNGKAVVTGNPVRSEFFEIAIDRNKDETFRVLIFGGSQGARAINDAMLAALPLLNDLKARNLRLTHQTGAADFERLKSEYEKQSWASDEARVTAYIDDMVSEFAEADLIISRAGATTSAELVAAGRAAIMIPLPTAADDHQRKNAEALHRAGAAKMILQNELTGDRLANEIKALATSPETLKQMELNSRQLAKPDAAAWCVRLIEKIVR